ncbi:MAG: ComEC/Rec2 family competence protein [bacterium]|nr:ComEC/Rec2 family competence protein [bacterium]
MSRLLFFLCLIFLAGVFVWSFSPLGNQYPNEFGEFVGKTVMFKGTIVGDVQERIENTQLVVLPEGAKKGKILVTTDRFKQYRYGDILEVSGKLLAPVVFEEFDYPGYLQSKSVHAVMYYPKIAVLKQGKSPLFVLKDKLRDVISSFLQPSKAATFGALLLGDQGKMTTEWKDKLNKTGLRHITAISGQHVVILTRMLLPFFLWLGLWRRQAVFLSFACMVLFILLTGMQSSAIRAGIMGGLLLFSEFIGRMNVALRGLVFAAAIMLLLNPWLLKHDPGFQLSFLASLGIIFALPFFTRVLKFLPATLSIRENLAVNFSAQLFTLPLLIHNFGYVSLVGVLTNLLLLPVIPLLIGIGFVFLLGGLVSGVLGAMLSFPVQFLMGYYHFIVEFFSSVPFASLSLKNFSLLWLSPFYLASFWLLRKFKQERFMV